METLMSIIQAAAALFIAYGAFLCLFYSDRRAMQERPSGMRRRRMDAPVAAIVDLPAMAAGRRTDFSIGFHQLHKRAA